MGSVKDWIAKRLEGTLEALYEAAIGSAGGRQATAQELAEEYRSRHATVDEAVASLIRWQVAKTGAAGFAAGVPGAIALPITIPADLTNLWYTQLRMVAAIACMYGHDPKDDAVRTIAFISLLGSSGTKTLNQIGVTIGVKGATAALKRLPGHLIIAVNRAVGFRLLTKFGEKGVVNLIRWVPLAGGVVGGTVNAVGTRATGAVARMLLRPA